MHQGLLFIHSPINKYKFAPKNLPLLDGTAAGHLTTFAAWKWQLMPDGFEKMSQACQIRELHQC